MKGDIYERAKGVPIREILNHYEIPIYKDKVNCLIHNEDTPSAHIYDQNGEDNHIKCFGCNKSYDGITVVMQCGKMDFSNAIKYLANNFVSKGNFVAKKKRDLSLYFAINKQIRDLVNHGKDKSIILKYTGMIDMFSDDKVMLKKILNNMFARL